MKDFLAFTIIGIVTGSIYAVAASGLVLTYTTSGIFNFAHGGIGMFMAFTYWELRFNHHLPAPLAIFLVVFVFAPLLGALIERVLMRNLSGRATGTSLVVTIGLMVMLMGVAQGLWPPQSRQFPEFFGGDSGFRLFGIFVTTHQLITIIVALVTAAVFWYLLNKTRTGTAMRAVVDDRALAALNGASPARISMLAWAMGASLAAVAGILIAPILNLEILNLTLIVVVCYAAAVVGLLKSLPRTFAGAMILGLLTAYLEFRFLHADKIPGLRGSLPTLMLFAALMLMPEERLRVGRLAGERGPRVPNLMQSVRGGVILVVAATIVSFILSDADLVRMGQGLALGLIMLSLVVLTGYGGQTSLAQMTFVGMGAFAMARFGAGGNPLGLLMAPLLAAPIGALVALPALRLQGLYLALATMAFGVLAEQMLFPRAWLFGSGTRDVPRLDVLGVSFSSEQAFFILLAVAFAVLAILVLMLRRGRFGRLVSAMRDSPAACTTLGVNLTTTKLGVFALSAAMAGFAGAFYGGLRGSAQTNDFLMFQSLPVLLMAVIGGITTVSGALFGGLLLGLLQTANATGPLAGLVFLFTGGAAVSLGRNPHGVAFFISQRLESLRQRLPKRLRPADDPEPPSSEGEVSKVAAAAS
jgi:branched-chain amino acid transport system permease protein